MECIPLKDVGPMNAATYSQILCQNLEDSANNMGWKSFIFSMIMLLVIDQRKSIYYLKDNKRRPQSLI